MPGETLPSGRPSKQFDPDSKMNLVNQGQLMHPACCTSCGSGTSDEGFLDLGVYYDYEGQLYLCYKCVNEAAESVGLLNDTEIRYLEAMNTDLVGKAAEAEKLLEAANERLSHYDSLFDVKFDDLSANSNISTNDAEGSETNVESSVSGTGEDSEPSESVTGAGPADVSGNESSYDTGLDL